RQATRPRQLLPRLLATGCVARRTRSARRRPCLEPGSAPCANLRDSSFWDLSLQLIPNVERNFPESPGFAPVGFAHCTLLARGQPARVSIYRPFPSAQSPVRPGVGLVLPIRASVFRSAPAGA